MHRRMNLRRNNIFFPSLNIINIKTALYGSKGFLIHYKYRPDQKLCQGDVSVRIINHSCHDFTTQISLTWNSKIKDTCTQSRYGRVYDCKYSPIIGYQNNWIIMNLIDDGKDEV